MMPRTRAGAALAVTVLAAAASPAGAAAVSISATAAVMPSEENSTRERVPVQASDLRTLQEELVDEAEHELRPAGLFVDRQRVRMSVSAPLPPFGTFYVRHTWKAALMPPPLPLTFEVVSPGRAANAAQIMLAVALQREVWVATRRLLKGSAVACTDLTLERRDIHSIPRQALANSCRIDAASVALRDIAARDVIRSNDVGRALDVTAGAPVNITVSSGGISVTTSAIALADARVGDLIPVRLQRPARTLHTRVTGPGSVQLVDGS